MAYTVSSLTNYVHENEKKILRAAIFSGKTLSYPGINIMPGVKASENVNNLSVSGSFQRDTGCNYNSSGVVTFSGRQVTVTKIKVQETYCPDDLEPVFVSKLLLDGSNYKKNPIEKELMDLKAEVLNSNLEKAIWQSDTTNHTFDTNLKQFNGWLQVIDAASPVYATATADITFSNVISIHREIISLIPAQILNTERHPVIFEGWDTFRILLAALTSLNQYHYTTDDAAKTGEILFPGTNTKVVAVHGLNNISGTLSSYKDRIVCTYPANLVFGTDLKSDYEKFEVFYSQEHQNIKTSLKFKAGTQVAFPSEIVTYKNS